MKTVQVKNVVIGEGVPKICVPFIGKNKRELMDEVESIAHLPVDIVEWRMDYFENIMNLDDTKVMLHELRVALKDVVILSTFRNASEGGEKEIDKASYVALNKMIVDSGDTDILDVELCIGDIERKKMIEYAHAKHVYVIMSNHDFMKTPSYDDIIARLCKMQELGGDILKIAVMPTCKRDVLTLVQATSEMYERYANRPLVTISMATTGVLSRVCGETIGSAITFGVAKQASASGQMAVKDLKTVLELIHKSM